MIDASRQRERNADGGPDLVTSDDTPQAQQVAALFRTHNAALIGFLQSRLDSAAEAQEVAQEAYERLLRVKNLEKIEYLRSYLFHIAANIAVDRWRSRERRDTATSEALFTEWLSTPSPDQRALAADQLQVVRKALRELPQKTSQAFVLHVIEGLSFEAIAARMKLGERMVRYHVARALAHCRDRVDSAETGP